MHINRLESGTVKRRGHLDLAVDTLLSQYRHFRLCPSTDKGCRYVFVDVVAELNAQSGVAGIQQSDSSTDLSTVVGSDWVATTTTVFVDYLEIAD